METEEDITVKIKGGEMTIDKKMIKSIRRPVDADSAPVPSDKK